MLRYLKFSWVSLCCSTTIQLGLVCGKKNVRQWGSRESHGILSLTKSRWLTKFDLFSKQSVSSTDLTGVLVYVIHYLGKDITGHIIEGHQGEIILQASALPKVVIQQGLEIIASPTEKYLKQKNKAISRVHILQNTYWQSCIHTCVYTSWHKMKIFKNNLSTPFLIFIIIFYLYCVDLCIIFILVVYPSSIVKHTPHLKI